MEHKSARQKKEIMARIRAFSHCGLSCKLSGNISYFKSFVGRDFKAIMQIALFIFEPYFNQAGKECWILLSKVNL